MIKRFPFFFFFLLPLCALPAQTAAELDLILEAPRISAAQGARFVLGAADLLPPELTGQAAADAACALASERGWLRVKADDPLRVKDASLLVMGAFGFRGGILYSVFRNPRYACREMRYLKLIPGNADPDSLLSGPRLLHIISAALARTGEPEL